MWLVGGICGCGYQEAGVVRMYRCGYWVLLQGGIYMYIGFRILLIPTPLVLYGSFLQQHRYFFVHFKNVFCSCLCYFCTI